MNYVELWIGNPAETKLDLNQEFNIALQYSIADIKNITKRNSAFSKTILLPGTKNNNYWMGNLYDVNTDFTMFNPNIKTPATLSVNSEVVMKGFLQLRKIKKLNNVDQQGNLINYEVVLFNNAVDLITELGEKTLNQLNLDELRHDYTAGNIIYSWTQSWTNGWVYPMYGDKNKNNQYGVTDFYPSYYSRFLIDKIFDEAGFGWTGSLRTNSQFLREILPFVGSGSQSLAQDEIDEQNFRVGITQSFTFSQLIGPGFTAPANSGSIISSNPPSSQFNFTPSWTYSLPADNYQDPLNPLNNLYDNNNTWNTTTSTWTTTVNRKWAPVMQLNYDLQFTNPSTSSNVHIYSATQLFSQGFNVVNKMSLDIVHTLEYKLPFTSAWLQWDTATVRKFGWSASVAGYAPGLTYSENINLYKQCQELLIPAGTQVRIRTFVKPCAGGGAAPFNINTNPYACYQSTGTYSVNASWHTTNSPRRMRMTVRYRTAPQNYLFSNGVIFAAQEGDPIDATDWISSKVKQKDFINDLIKRYNLYIQVDPSNERMLILDTRPDFYDKVLNLDWTDKKDYSSEDEISLLAELQFKEMLFTMKSDTTDEYNKDYQALVGEVYGQYKYTFGNEFVKGQQKIESPFSPTPLIKTTFGAVTPALSPEDPKVNPRVLYWGGLKTPDQAGFQWKLISQYTTYTYTSYPYAGHFDDPFNPTLDIHFGTPKYMYYTDYKILPTDTMYETYWSDYVNQIEDGRLVKSKFYLDEYDIRLIKDNFWAKIFILDSYYYVNKIIDYMPMQNGLTTVELLKIKEGQKYKQQPARTSTISRQVALVKPNVSIPNFGSGNNGGFIGNITIGSKNKSIGTIQVDGDIQSTKQIILGDNNTVNGDNSGVLGGNNNTLNSSGNWLIQSSNIVTEGENLVVISRDTATISDSSSMYMGTGIKGDLASKPGRYDQYQKGVNLSVEGYDLGQSDWRYIPSTKEVVIQAGKESRPSDLTVFGSLEIQDIVATASFGGSVVYEQGFLEVENQLNIDGVMTVGGELHVGKCMVGGGGGSGQSGSSGTSGTSFGSSGTSGTSGTSGSTGQSGTSGTSGSTGQSGTSGTSGVTITQNLDQTLTVGNTGSVILLENGSLSTPSYSFASDTDTGIYRYATNGLSITTGGEVAANFTGRGIYLQPGGLTALSLGFIGDNDTGIYRNTTNRITVVTGGVTAGTFYSGGFIGLIKLQDGSETGPSLTFANDQNTGIYSRGDNVLGIAAGGATAAVFGTNSLRIPDGVETLPGLSFISQPNMGLYRPSANIMIASVAGVAKFGFLTNFVLNYAAAFRNQDGTAAGPSFTFNNDPDTGVYRAGLNTVGIAAGGVTASVFTSTGLALTDGSVSNPSLSFVNDPDTGIFRRANLELNFTIDGTELLRLDADTAAAKLNILNNGTPTAVSLGINDNNTGLYRPATDQLGISAGGVTASVFTSTGVVFHKNPRLYSPDGTLWEISVLNTGALTASVVV